MENEKEFIFYLLKKQKERLMKYVDLGYAEAHAKIMHNVYCGINSPKILKLSYKDEQWIEFFKDEAKEFTPLIERLEKIIYKKDK